MEVRLMAVVGLTLSVALQCTGEVKVYKQDGDFIIGGFFMLHDFDEEANKCHNLLNIASLRRVEAMAFAVSKINNDSSILDGFTLGYEIYDSCSSIQEAVRKSFSFIPPLRETDNVIGLVGPQRSSPSIQVTNVMSIFNITLISYLATSDELSNSYRYPYFLRTVPPDKFQVTVITDILTHYGWKYVAFLYSDDSYGKNAEAEFSKQAENSGICVGYSRSISVSADKNFYNNTINDLLKLKKDSLISVVVLYILREILGPFFEHARAANIDRDFIWIGGDGWGNYGLDPLRGSEESALGAFTIIPKQEPHPEFSSYFQNTITSSDNPWVHEYMEAADSEGETFPQNVTNPSYESIVIDSVEVLARGLDTMRNEMCNASMNASTCRKVLLTNRPILRDHLLQISFNSSSSGVVAFTGNGDSKGRYDIMYLRKTKKGEYRFDTVGSWLDARKEHLHIDPLEWFLKYEVTTKGTTHTANKVPKSVCRDPCGRLEVQRNNIHDCCWICEVCEDNEIIENNECVSCFVRETQTFMWPNQNLTHCIPLENLKLLDQVENIVILAVAAVGIIAVVSVAYLYIKNREKRLIKASSRELGYIILVGLFLSYSSAILYSTPPSQVTCILRRVIPNIGTAFIYVSLGTMTVRLYRIFRSGKKSTGRPKFISPKSQVFLTFSLSLIPLAWSLVWIFITPPDINVIEPTKFRQFVGTTCVASTTHRIGQLAWDLYVVVVCCYFAFKTRNLPANYNQTRFIAFCVFSTLVVFIAFAPAFFTTQETSQQNLYTAIGAIIQSTVVLLLIFIAKLYALYYVKEEDQQLVSNVSGSSSLHRGRTQDSDDQGRKENVGTVSENVQEKFPNRNGCYNQSFSDFGSQTIEAEFSSTYKSIENPTQSVNNRNNTHTVDDDFEIVIKDENSEMSDNEKRADLAKAPN